MTISTFPQSSQFAYTNSSQQSHHNMDIFTGASFQVSEACNLTGCQVATQGVTGYGGTYKFELWPLSTTSLNTPDMSGSVLATSATFNPTAWFGIWEANFTSPYAATAGQFLCVVLKPVSGVDLSNYSTFNYRGGAIERNSFPQAMKTVNAGSSWATEYYGWPGIAVKTNLSYNLGGTPIMGGSTQNMYEVGDRVAQKFTIPVDEDSETALEIHCKGFYYTGYATTSGETLKYGAWDVDGNPLVTPVVLDHEYLGIQMQYNSGGYFYFNGDLKMVSGGTYYLGWESNSTDTTQISAHRYGKVGADYTLTETPGDPDRNWPGDSWMNIEAFHWDMSVVEAWKPIMTNYGGGRMCLNPLLGEIHGVSNVTPNTTKGKGDKLNERAPSRVKDPNKPGYQLNEIKTISRDNGQYGWNPYA